jgi:hypothetical protein
VLIGIAGQRCEAADDEPALATTICTVIRKPLLFDGKRIRFAAEFVSDGMDNSVLVDHRCKLGITPFDAQTHQTQSELDALDHALETGMAGTLDKRLTAVFVGVFAYRSAANKQQRILYIERVINLRVLPKHR